MWEQHSDYVLTPGYCVSPNDATFALSPSLSSVFENSVDPKSKRGPYPLRFLPLHEWEEGRAYIHYRIEWRVIVNNREVSMDTEII
jgi:hypothetical protein